MQTLIYFTLKHHNFIEEFLLTNSVWGRPSEEFRLREFARYILCPFAKPDFLLVDSCLLEGALSQDILCYATKIEKVSCNHTLSRSWMNSCDAKTWCSSTGPVADSSSDDDLFDQSSSSPCSLCLLNVSWRYCVIFCNKERCKCVVAASETVFQLLSREWDSK